MGARTVMDTNNIVNLVAKIQELEKENARLKAILDKHGITYKAEETISVVHNEDIRPVTPSKFSLQEKVALFQSLFQGRDDVFARRWYRCVVF